MHPAASVIIFTTLTGAGYGLLVWLGLFAAFGLLPAEFGFGLLALALALGLVSAGLLASTAHLGHPERAWRALSQWRTSWLSREGVMALAAYVPAGLFAIGWVFLGRNDGIWAMFGLVASVASAATVYCTGMIYASLKPVQRWCNAWVVPGYLLLALMTGALLLNILLHLFALQGGSAIGVAILAVAAGWAAKRGYWRFIDTTSAASTPASATGLGRIGAVRLLDAPHTEENYLLKEMGFQLARKHAAKLRRIAELAGFAMPFALSLGVLWANSLGAGGAGLALAVLAALSAALGVAVERWLFFGEAKHTVMLYYGAGRA
ncbi:MAG: dimethyl sulfoxide reductase anchor subunit [Alphaproteobacteria bacterium]|nr:dimethyl sulfoxide reductase anchor subunit [Alphaproteobacteria bacterium]